MIRPDNDSTTVTSIQSIQHITVCGSINIDIYLSIDKLPHPGQTINTTSQNVVSRLGGKSTNQAIAILRASQLVSIESISHTLQLHAFAGDDAYGKQLHDQLYSFKSHNTDSLASDSKYNILFTPRIELLSSHCTGQAYILHQSSGNNSIILVNGANYTGWHHQVTQHDTIMCVAESDVLLLACEIPLSVNLQLVQCLKQNQHKSCILDLGGNTTSLNNSHELSQLLQIVDTIMPNESELFTLVDVESDTNNSTELYNNVYNAVQLIHSKYNSKVNVLVTLGEYGSIYFCGNVSNDQCGSIIQLIPPSHTTVNVIDTTGAGDCYRGCYTYHYYTQSKDIIQSMIFATAAAELSVQVSGAAESMPHRNDIDARITSTQYNITQYSIIQYKQWLHHNNTT